MRSKFSRKHLNIHFPHKSFIPVKNLEIHMLLSLLDIVAHNFFFKNVDNQTEKVFWND